MYGRGNHENHRLPISAVLLLQGGCCSKLGFSIQTQTIPSYNNKPILQDCFTALGNTLYHMPIQCLPLCGFLSLFVRLAIFIVTGLAYKILVKRTKRAKTFFITPKNEIFPVATLKAQKGYVSVFRLNCPHLIHI